MSALLEVDFESLLARNWFIRRSLEHSNKVQKNVRTWVKGSTYKKWVIELENEAKWREIEVQVGRTGKKWLMTLDHCLIKSMYPTHACVRVYEWNQDMDRIIKSRWNYNVGSTYDQIIRKKGIGMNGPDDPYIREGPLEK